MKLKKRIKHIKLVRQNLAKVAIVREQINNFSFERQKAKSFAVVCRGRSGSTCFLDLLASQPKILTDPHTFFDYDNLPLDFSRPKFVNSQKNIFGFKFRAQPNDQSTDLENIKIAQDKYNSLVEQGVQIFYLKRGNILKRAISGVVANNKQRKHNYQQGDTISQEKLELSLEEILQRLELCDRQTKFDTAVMAEVPHILIDYERDLKAQSCHQATLDRCCESLQLEEVEAQTKFVKISPNKFADYIANWSEIFEAISNSPYKSYL